jgi:hypothetical protein
MLIQSAADKSIIFIIASLSLAVSAGLWLLVRDEASA